MVVTDCMGTKSNKISCERETIFNFTRIEQVSRIEHFVFFNFTRGRLHLACEIKSGLEEHECRHRTNCTNSVDISEVADVGVVSAVQGTTMIAEQSCVVTHEEGKSAENNLYVVEGTASPSI
ncbi:hypothetical protein ACS0TY_023092 [Phlomoides rotata]